MINNVPKPHRIKQDRYDKFNKSSMILRESSFMGSSVETTVTLSPDVFIKEQPQQCRICLHEQDPQGRKELFSVCKCTGSVKYLHEHCFASWVNRSLQQKPPQQRRKILQHGSQCQLCKQIIPIQQVTISSCASLKLIKYRISKKPFLFTIYTTISFLSMVVIGFVVGMMSNLQLGFEGDKIVNTIVLIGSLVVLVSLTVGVGYSYVIDYFMDEKVVVIGFGQVVHQEKNREQNIKNNNFDQNNVYSSINNHNNSINSQNPIRQRIVSNNSQRQKRKQNQQINISIQPLNLQQSHQNVMYVASSLQQLQP